MTLTADNCKLRLPVRATSSLVTDDDCEIAAGTVGYVTTHSSEDTGIGEYEDSVLAVVWEDGNFSSVHLDMSRARVVYSPTSCFHSSMDDLVIHRH